MLPLSPPSAEPLGALDEQLPSMTDTLPAGEDFIHSGTWFSPQAGPVEDLNSRETWLGGASQGCPHLQQSVQCIPLGPYHQGSHPGSASPNDEVLGTDTFVTGPTL